MNIKLKAINTMQKGRWTVLELRATNGYLTPAMRAQMATHFDAVRVLPSQGRTGEKFFVITGTSSLARKGDERTRFVAELSSLASAA